jgi:hypothetical protein
MIMSVVSIYANLTLDEICACLTDAQGALISTKPKTRLSKITCS